MRASRGVFWGGGVTVLAISLSVAVTGCRAADPTHGEPLHRERIYGGPPVSLTGGSFISGNADLASIQSVLRAPSFGVHGDLNGSGFFWAFDGATEEFNPAADTAHTGPNTRALESVPLGSLNALSAEIMALNMSASALGLPPAPTIPLPDLVDDVSVVVQTDETTVEWAPTSQPALRFTLPLRVRVDLDDVVDALFDVDDYTTPLLVDVTPQPCGTGLAVACLDSGDRQFAGYRTSIATSLGYDPGDFDVAYPAQGLNFATAASGRPRETAGSTSYTPGCVASIAADVNFVIGVLGLSAEDAALFRGLASLANGLSGLAGGSAIAAILCDMTARQIDEKVRAALDPIPAGLGGVADLLVNPPSGTVRFPVPTGLSVPTFRRGRARAQLQAPGPGAPLATNADGSLTDAFLTTLVTGGVLTPTRIALDLRPVINHCAATGDTGATGCGACGPGGVCAGPMAMPACACICAGGQLAPTPVVLPPPAPGVDCVGSAGDPIALPATGSPIIANLLSGAPLFAETVRRWFANPLPPGGRYVSAEAAPGRFSRGARFEYIVDPDDDFISSELDLCPDVFDPTNADDGDGDVYGAACDLCPGIADSRAMANADADGDERPNGCDCDADWDGCNNAGFELSAGGVAECAPTGDAFDRLPYVTTIVDFDMDGTFDDCDLDRDGDTVPDAIDNCPLGDGDSVFEPGVDTNPSQTDTNGDGFGDVCDRLCPPACDPPGGGGGSGGAGGGAAPDAIGRVLDHLAGIRACAGLSGGRGPCDLQALLECDGFEYDRCWLPDAHDALVLVDDIGLVRLRVDPAQLGLDGGISSNAMLLWDLDGDDFDDFAVAAPRSSKCPPGQQGPMLSSAVLPPPGNGPPPPPEPCAAAGAVGFFSSRTGALLGYLTGPGPGARFGEGMAVQGNTLAIGAPGLNGDQGAVFVYRIDQAGVELRSQLAGGAAGDLFGAYLAPALDAQSVDPSFLAGAPGAHGGDGELVLLDGARGIWERFQGPVPGGRMSRGVVTAGLHARTLVVGAMPDAYSGAGALAFFTTRPGRARPDLTVYRGRPASRLGETVIPWSRPSGTRIVAGAPGGRGSVLAFDLRGRLVSTTGWVGHRFGVALSAPGDLNGDGLTDLLVGFSADPAGDDLLALQVFELAP